MIRVFRSSGASLLVAPLPVCFGKEFALVALVSVPQNVTISTRKLAGLAAFPELADGEIPAEMLRIHARRWSKQARKERLCPMKFCGVGSRIDHLELRKAAEQGLVVF